MKTQIIKEHQLHLQGKLGAHMIHLRPLCDAHFPLLYKWNTDPDVLYWNESPDADPNDEQTVQTIYNQVSNAGYGFIIELDDTAIGECLLCKVRVPYIEQKYPTSTDLRRIDILIGEKDYWGMGIGTTVVQMLLKFAFEVEATDVIYGITGDYNKRSGRVFEKNGFRLYHQCPTNNDPGEKGMELHFRLTRDEYKEATLD